MRRERKEIGKCASAEGRLVLGHYQIQVSRVGQRINAPGSNPSLYLGDDPKFSIRDRARRSEDVDYYAPSASIEESG